MRPSGEAGGGEGLFAARDIEAGAVISFYNGVRIRAGAEEVREEILNRFCVQCTCVLCVQAREAEEAEEWGDTGGYRSVLYERII